MTLVEPTRGRALRIVIGADTFPPNVNGAARFAQRLAQGLAGRGHDVHVICPSHSPAVGTTVVDGVTVHRLRSHLTPFHPTFRVCLPWQTSPAVAALLDRIHPDVVHVQAHFVVGRALATQAPRRGVPLVATNHFMPENLFGHARIPTWLRAPVARWAWRDLARVFRPAAVVTAPTPRAVRLLHENGLVQRAIPISCGIDAERFSRPDVRPRGDARTVLFVGRLDEEKRVDELLRAVALLPAELRVRAEIVGDGSCRKALEELADRLGVRERVTFRGFVSEEELVDAYARCDAFCMPGVAELQSLATMEAMAAGKPVVAADAMALPHLVRPGHNGWLFPPGDVRALADRLTELFTEPGALERMGAVSRALVAEHDIEATLDAFEEVYLRVMRRVGRATELAA